MKLHVSGMCSTMNFESHNDLRMLKFMLEEDGIQFSRYFFQKRDSIRFILNWHHFAINRVLEDVIQGDITRLIINVSPGYTKTEKAVIMFIARCMAKYPQSRYIHASYSSDLALFNSSKIRDVIELPEYQQLWPTVVRNDSKAKKRWYNLDGGGMMAAAAGGQISGFRAGTMSSGFTGAFVLDDANKPDDANSNVKRNAVNNRFNNTTRSRLALSSTPIIVIAQRTHPMDLSGFLLEGGSGDVWDHLVLPINNPDYNNLPEYKHPFGRRINVLETLTRAGTLNV